MLSLFSLKIRREGSPLYGNRYINSTSGLRKLPGFRDKSKVPSLAGKTKSISVQAKLILAGGRGLDEAGGGIDMVSGALFHHDPSQIQGCFRRFDDILPAVTERNFPLSHETRRRFFFGPWKWAAGAEPGEVFGASGA